MRPQPPLGGGPRAARAPRSGLVAVAVYVVTFAYLISDPWLALTLRSVSLCPAPERTMKGGAGEVGRLHPAHCGPRLHCTALGWVGIVASGAVPRWPWPDRHIVRRGVCQPVSCPSTFLGAARLMADTLGPAECSSATPPPDPKRRASCVRRTRGCVLEFWWHLIRFLKNHKTKK